MIITRNRAFRGRQTDEDICMTQISLTFPDGSARKYNAGITPAVIANSISKSLSKKAVSATVNGQHWDLAWRNEK